MSRKITNLSSGNDGYIVSYYDETVYAGDGSDAIMIDPYLYWDNTVTNSSPDVWDFFGLFSDFPVEFDPPYVSGPPVPIVYGEGGDDLILGSKFADYIDGGSGDDYISTGLGEDTVYAGSDNDLVIADASTYDRLDGGSGIDALELHYSGTVEFRFGLTGGSSSIGMTATNFEMLRYYGSALARDVISGGTLADTFRTYGGNDEVRSGGGNDYIDTGTGADYATGGDGHDRIMAGEGADIVVGGTGNDIIEGGAGDDILYGDGTVISTVGGNDIIAGGAGRDMMYGFGGQDTFVFRAVSELPAVYRSSPPSHNPDLTYSDFISNFDAGQDKIDLRAIDADGVTTNGDQSFLFRSGPDFSGQRGELIYRDYIDPFTGQPMHSLLGDTNGDLVADFAVNLPGINGVLTISDILP